MKITTCDFCGGSVGTGIWFELAGKKYDVCETCRGELNRKTSVVSIPSAWSPDDILRPLGNVTVSGVPEGQVVHIDLKQFYQDAERNVYRLSTSTEQVKESEKT